MNHSKKSMGKFQPLLCFIATGESRWRASSPSQTQGSCPAPVELCPGGRGDDPGFISISHNQVSTSGRHALSSWPRYSVKATISAVAGRRAFLLACFIPLYRFSVQYTCRLLAVAVCTLHTHTHTHTHQLTYMHTQKQPHTASSTDPGQHLLHTLH